MSTKLMPGKKKGEKAAGKGAYTSTRLFKEDSDKLSQLSSLRGEHSSAATFRIVFGPLLDAALIEAAERRAAELKKSQAEKPQ